MMDRMNMGCSLPNDSKLARRSSAMLNSGDERTSVGEQAVSGPNSHCDGDPIYVTRVIIDIQLIGNRREGKSKPVVEHLMPVKWRK